MTRCVVVLLALTILAAAVAVQEPVRPGQVGPSLRQQAEAALRSISLVGDWTGRYHEDQPDRLPGEEPGDFSGLPINGTG